MLPPAVLHPSNVAAVGFDAHLDCYVVTVAGVDLYAGTSAECSALLDDWESCRAEAYRALMSPQLAGWAKVA